MIIETKYLGQIEIDEAKIIYFDLGIPGFEDEKRFVLLDIPENNLLQILQSIQTPNLAFIVTNPHYFYKDYAITLNDHILEKLEIKDEKEVAILSIMTVKNPFHTSTINLKAPLVINLSNKCGKQYILNDETYTMKAHISLPTTLKRGD